jgi:hypothetical protein
MQVVGNLKAQIITGEHHILLVGYVLLPAVLNGVLEFTLGE